MTLWHTVFGDKKLFYQSPHQIKIYCMNLNFYSQFINGWECGFANVRLHLMGMKGLSSHTKSCHWQLRTFTTCRRQCFQHIPTHGTRCLPTHQHILQTRWDLIRCILIDGYQRFRATISFHSSFALKMEAKNSSQTLAIISETTWHHIPEEQNSNTYRGENLRAHMRTHQCMCFKFLNDVKFKRIWHFQSSLCPPQSFDRARFKNSSSSGGICCFHYGLKGHV